MSAGIGYTGNVCLLGYLSKEESSSVGVHVTRRTMAATQVPQATTGGGGGGWKLVHSDLTSDSMSLRTRGVKAALSRKGRISATACKPIAAALVRGVSAADPSSLRASLRQVRGGRVVSSQHVF